MTAALGQGLPVGTESPTWCIAAVLWGTLLALALRVAPFSPIEGEVKTKTPGDVETEADSDIAAASGAHEEGPPEGGPSAVDRR